MKIRNDFVTNSSSSSYILALKGISSEDREALDKLPTVKKYIELLEKLATNNSVVFTNIEDFSFFILETYSYNGNFDGVPEEIYKAYEEAEQLYREDYIMLAKEVDYNDEAGQEALDFFKSSGLIKILYDDG